MVIVDNALKAREESGNPIRVGMVGAGFMGKGVALQIIRSVPGMRLVAISNRNPEKARDAYLFAGVEDPEEVADTDSLQRNIELGRYSYTDDPMLLCRASGIDVLVDVTGDVEYGANVALEAIRNRKHLILMNAEVDGTIGPILHRYAQEAGVIVSGCDGDQPGVQMNLYRFVKSIGVTPLLCGNIKGLQDPYRNPTTQQGFAEKWGQNVWMVSSFADGTKISYEQAIVANATGFTIAKRGMYGHDFLQHTEEIVRTYGLRDFTGHIDDLTRLYDPEELQSLGGIVDYVVAMKPAPGVFVLGTHPDPRQRHYLNLYKLGEGPLYCFYTPYHLCHFELPHSIARVCLFNDPVMVPAYGPRVDVVATAKKDLAAGETIDALGGYTTFGQCERYDISLQERLLPIGLAEGCLLKRAVPKDRVLTYDDIELPTHKTSYRLRMEQDALFGGAPHISEIR